MNQYVRLMCGAALLVLVAVAASTNANTSGLAALYDFSNATNPFSDRSGNGLNMHPYGGIRISHNTSGTAAEFDGRGYLRLPLATPLFDGSADGTIVVRARGSGMGLHAITKEQNGRGPDFQICGDVLEYAYNTDQRHGATIEEGYLKNLAKSMEYNIHTGVLNLANGSQSNFIRTRYPRETIEPMLQFVNGMVYYRYFGTDRSGAWQMYTARATEGQSDWHTVVRTKSKYGYRVEFGTLQVAGSHIYYVYPAKDSHNIWQLWTASSTIDGSHWHARQRTKTGGFCPFMQVVGSKVYVIFGNAAKLSATLVFASMNVDGSDWKILKTIGNNDMGQPFALFQINKGVVYFTYSRKNRPDGSSYLWSARMNVDGTHFHSIQRTFSGLMGRPAYLQVVGSHVYYVYELRIPVRTSSLNAKNLNFGPGFWSYWFAESRLDGSGWATQRLFADPRDGVAPTYKGIQVIGGKTYLGVMIDKGSSVAHFIASEGSNLISRGGLYGIGVTSTHLVRAYVDSGQEYLCRGEAPSRTSGTIAEAQADPSAWHTYAAVFSHGLLKLYVDGKLKSSSTGDAIREGDSNYPLRIGDGFVGQVSKIAIYRRALAPSEIVSL